MYIYIYTQKTVYLYISSKKDALKPNMMQQCLVSDFPHVPTWSGGFRSRQVVEQPVEVPVTTLQEELVEVPVVEEVRCRRCRWLYLGDRAHIFFWSSTNGEHDKFLGRRFLDNLRCVKWRFSLVLLKFDWNLMWSDLNGDGDKLIDVLPFHSLLVYCSADVTLLARRLQIVLSCTIFVIAAGRTEILRKVH